MVLEAEKVKEKMKMAYFVCGGTKQDGVSTVDLSGANNTDLIFVGDGKYTKTQNLQEISEIGTGAFSNCEAVQKVILPVSVSEIGESAFEGCKGLQIVEYRDTENSQASNQTEDVNQSEEPGQAGNTAQDVRITVYANAFKDCSSLETVIFPQLGEEGAITIAKNAFAGCIKLRTVVLCGKGTFNIPPEAFCHSKEVTLIITAGSDAEAFAVEYGIKHTSVKDS